MLNFPAVTIGAPLVLGLVGVTALLNCRRLIVGTTLTWSWWWAVLSVVAVAGCEVAAAVMGPEQIVRGLRYAAAVTTFCPMMAVLGGKRPQHGMWQFIVLSLWAILALPAGEAWLRSSGGSPDIGIVRSWFLVILIAIGPLNYIATRFFPSSVLAAAGQICLLWQCLPWAGSGDWPYRPLWGLLLGVLAIALVAIELPRPQPAKTPLDKVWRDFRDLYGTVWTVRVAQRINAAAHQYGLPIMLTWHGVAPLSPNPQGAAPADAETACENQLKSLLRRFVTAEWVAERAAAD